MAAGARRLAIVLWRVLSSLAFLVGVGLPAWWLGYLTLLARPVGPDGALEWYPPGRLVLWCAVIGPLVILAALSQLGSSEATIKDALRGVFVQLLRAQMQIADGAPLTIPGVDDPDRLIDVMVIVLPLIAVMLTTLTEMLNLWLATHIVRISGRLKRPWPELSAMRFPPATSIVLAAALAGSFLPDIVGTVAALPAASLLVAYAILGFAVLHAITRNRATRAIVLTGLYTAVAIFGWPVLLMTLLGLIDTALDLRRRVAARGPPAPLA